MRYILKPRSKTNFYKEKFLKTSISRLIQKSAAILLSVGLTGFPLRSAIAIEIEVEDLFDMVSRRTITTTTLSSIPVSKTPGTVSMITNKEIRDYGAATLDEAIALLPGVDTRMTPMGYQNRIRGFGANPFSEDVQYQIDGLLYNSPDKGGSSANPGYSSFPVPIEMVKQVEVVREPISALYGPNAFNGVINVLTKSGKDFENGGTIVSRMSNSFSGRNSQRYAIAGGGVKGDFDIAAGGEFSRQLGPMIINKDSDIRDASVNAKVKYKDFEFGWYSLNEESEPFVFSTTVTAKTSQDVYLTGLTYNKDISHNLSVMAKSSWLSRKGTNCSVCHNPQGYKTTDPTDNRESFDRFYEQAFLKYKMGEKHEITTGAEFSYDKEHMDGSVLGNPEAVKRTYSGLLQYIVKVTEKVTATLGTRADSSDWSRTGMLLSPRALFVFTPTDRTSLRTGYTRAYRLPTFHETSLFMKFLPGDPAITTSGNLFVMGNPGLVPETIDTFNLGTDHWVTKNALVKINGFYSIVNEQIDRRLISTAETVARLPNGKLPNGENPTTTGPAPRRTIAYLWANNPSEAHVLGGEIEYIIRPFQFLELAAHYDYKTVRFNEDTTASLGGAKAPNAPEHLMGASVTAYPIKRLMMNVTGRYRGEYFGLYSQQATVTTATTFFDGSVATPDAFFLDFHISYLLPYGFRASILGRNMLNQEAQDWKVRADTRLTTGRDLFLQLAYDFGGSRN